ncbi:hypothetical protein SGPA1_11211 [Streptomyces misionensis JCM 4497]
MGRLPLRPQARHRGRPQGLARVPRGVGTDPRHQLRLRLPGRRGPGRVRHRPAPARQQARALRRLRRLRPRTDPRPAPPATSHSQEPPCSSGRSSWVWPRATRTPWPTT